MRMSYEMHKICMKTPYEMLITRLESLTLSLRHLFKDKTVRYVKKEHVIGIISVKGFFRNMN